MKKYLLSLVAISALLSQGVYAQDMYQSAKSWYQERRARAQEEGLQKKAKQMRGGQKFYYPRRYIKGGVAGVAGGAVTGAALGAVPGIAVGSPEVAAFGAAVGMKVGAQVGALGGTFNLAYKAGLRRHQVKNIDKILADNTDETLTFKTLSREQATLILAAYKRNVGALKRLINKMPEFVNQEGVWQTLTELFYNQKPTSSRVKQLKKEISAARA